jgi:anti-sigma regulatory factor (Ser/Thr protein kinase)
LDALAEAAAAPGWGAPGMAGSAGMSFMDPLRRLSDRRRPAGDLLRRGGGHRRRLGGRGSGRAPRAAGAPAGRHVAVLGAPANVPLGVPPPAAYRGREHTLDAGSVLMLYSNGLIGRTAPDPVAGARSLLSRGRATDANLERLAERLVAGVVADRPRDDAVLLARYEGAAGDRPPRTGQLHIQRHDLRGVRGARGFVHDRLCSWGLDAITDDLELAASEIVTNALVHAGSDVDVRLWAFTDHVRLEVRDSDSDPPVPSAPSLSEEGKSQAEHGRGLFLVDAVAGDWNSSPNGRGRTVWLELAIPGR